MYAFNHLKLSSAIMKLAKQQIRTCHVSVISKPKVPMTFKEKCLHGLFFFLGCSAYPMYVSQQINKFREQGQ